MKKFFDHRGVWLLENAGTGEGACIQGLSIAEFTDFATLHAGAGRINRLRTCEETRRLQTS